MPFRPKPEDKIEINLKQYRFTEHPSAPKMVYGQAGRRATVYQLQGEAGQLYALKVFKNAWRDPRNAVSAQQLHTFATLPGLEVCNRNVITPKSHAKLISMFPDLEYSVLMRWVIGETWQEVMLSGRAMNFEQSRELGLAFLDILVSMERKGLAHCDLSGPNVLLNFNPLQVALVDVEEMYGPGLVKPGRIGGGSSGYAHKTAPKGLWRADADRFAGAVLLAEMLGWCDERVRKIAYGEQVFDPEEVQQNSERYQVLLCVLREQWDSSIADTFNRVWFSEKLEDCPSFQEWQNLINHSPQLIDQDWLQEKIAEADRLLGEDQLEEAIRGLEELYQMSPEAAAGTYARALLTRGTTRERDNDLDGALLDYQKALQIAPEGGLQDELKLIVNETEQRLNPPGGEEETSPVTEKTKEVKNNNQIRLILLGILILIVAFLIGRWSVSYSGNLYFASNRSGRFEIYRLDNSQSVRVIHSENGGSWDPVTSPKGVLYFTSDRTGKEEIYYLSGVKAVQVTHTTGSAESWSPFFVDNILHFVSNRSGKAEIWRIVDGKAQQVTKTPDNAISIISR